MSEGSNIRLNKVLRELNISLDRAIEYLSDKGHKVEARPTTKISNQIYDLLLDEFQSDKSSKDETAELFEEKRKEKEILRIKQEKIDLERIKIEEQRKVIKAASKVILEKPKQVDKIDLDSKNKIEVKQNHSIEIKTEKIPENIIKLDKKIEKNVEKIVNKNLITQYKKLTGPTITGKKIDLDKIDEKQKTVDNNRKKKRKRISKEPLKKETPGGANGFVVQKNNSVKVARNTQSNNKQQKQSSIQKVEPTQEEVQKQIRETLEKLQGKSNKSKGAKYRRDKRDQHRQKSDDELAQIEADSKTIKVTEFITVGEVAILMEIGSTEIISACMSLGIMVTMNQRLDAETLTIVADEFGFEVEFVKSDVEQNFFEEEDIVEDNLEPRAPIVTVMGHVDHGKTLLLDYIRKENVIAIESGGITQHIGAYSVFLENNQKITFLDTPGHEAFTAMRARGAQVTDIAIIVIAADDNIMPQTKEAISHAQAASVPIVFAINKIDKNTANPDKIKEALAGMNLMVEDWGGKIQSHDISALNGLGVKELLEKVLLEAELLELKANSNRNAKGTVLEAYLDKGRGYVSTILVQNGTLKIGDYILAGKQSGKVKAMFDERGQSVQFAAPSTPISILGLDGAAQAGDNFNVLKDEKEAKQIAAKRTQLLREQNVRTQKHITLDEIGRRIALGEFKELNLILKGDVDGSVEALTDSFQKLSTEEIQVNIIHKGVGAITESDVLLASESDAIIIGFNVRPSGNSRILATKEEIDIRSYSIIYDAINDVKDAMEGLLSPEMKEEISGDAEIREIFKISKIGTIAGCMVTTGKIYRNSNIRIIREGIVQYSGTLLSLKRFKDDVKELAKGYDCGLQIKNYNDIQIGDLVEFYKEIAIKKKL